MSLLAAPPSLHPRGSGVLPWPVAVACLGSLLARLALRIDYAEELDSIRFLLALEQFDVARYQPHFPGYPVFVLLGRGFLWAMGAPVPALATLCAGCGALLPIPVALFARETLGEREASWAAWLAAANPLLWLHSQMLLSDVPGLLFLFTGLAVLSSGLAREKGDRRQALGCLLIGITLGVRLSYFPFALSAMGLLAWRRRPLAFPAALLGAGVLCWALPLVWVSGWSPLLSVARVQGAGHFQRWGGSVVTEVELGARLATFIWQLAAQGLAIFWTDRSWMYLVPTAGLVAVLALAFSRASKPPPTRLALWFLWVGPYAGWAFFAQNVALKARHVLPLVVFLVLLVAWAIARALEHPRPLARGVAATGATALFCGQLASGLALTLEHRDVPSNAVRAAQALASQCAANPGRPVVAYTANLARHLWREAPCVEAVAVARLSEAKRDLGQREPRTAAFVLSDVAHVERLGREPFLQLRRDRYIQLALSDLALFRLDGPAPSSPPGDTHP